MRWLRKTNESSTPVRVKDLDQLAKVAFGDFVPTSISISAGAPEFGRPAAPLSPEHAERLQQLMEFKSQLLAQYPERRYLIADYLPASTGAVLDVGVSWPNERDCEALPDPSLHSTIDTDPTVAQFGSPHGHSTMDFFALSGPPKFAHLILFGMIGTPNNRTEQDAHITPTHNDAMIDHVDELLLPGGQVVLGPELNGESRAAADKDVADWLNWIERNEVLAQKYELTYALRGRCNLVVVLRKSS